MFHSYVGMHVKCFSHRLLQAFLCLPKILRRSYHLLVRGLSSKSGSSQRRNESKVESSLVDQVEDLEKQSEQTVQGKIGNPGSLQRDVESAFGHSKVSSRTINSLLHSNTVTKGEFEIFFYDELKQVKRFGEKESIC